ncbi:MAG: response regulator [Planctomycetes bacterium]|nr:response regulator [Planctomycetota bacterium]MCB9887820.1 response regulator [Planctomycetota bacterium]
MSEARIEVSAGDFAAIVPFGFVTDRAGKLLVVGNSLRRRLGAEPGQSVAGVFKVVRPWRIQEFLDLPVNPGAAVMLRAVASELELKGSTMAVCGGEAIAFIGSAVVRDLDEFQQRELLISDFAPSDATPDLLLSMQATRTGLEDARKLGAELKVALADARAGMEAKARFLAMMSHEIRTPLNGFGAMIDVMRDGDLSDEQRESLDTMDQCARSLLGLVNDILEFSKLEAGRVRIVPEPVDVGAALTRIVDHFRVAARERTLDLRLDLDLGDVQWASLDFERVRQVTANLIGNSLKFTSTGAVQVRVAWGSEDRLVIDVRDSGIGISDECRAQLFEPFVQADNSTTRRFGGTGLGLTISRQLAQSMGGNVELVRSDGAGSHFRFTLLAPRCEPPIGAACPVPPVDPVTFDSASILVVEDDRTNQLVAKKLLRKLAIVPTVVEDGLAAVEVAKTRRFDLILMDLMMPKLGGLDATRQIRSGDGPCRDVPIIAFSAAAFEGDREAAAQAGMTAFFEKPARLEALRQILRTHLPSHVWRDGVGAPDAPPQP